MNRQKDIQKEFDMLMRKKNGVEVNNGKLISIRPYNKGFMVLTYENDGGKWQEIKESEW